MSWKPVGSFIPNTSSCFSLMSHSWRNTGVTYHVVLLYDRSHTEASVSFTNPELSKGPACGSRLQAEKMWHVGQCLSPDAVEHHASQPGLCQTFLWFLQEASNPDTQNCNQSKPQDSHNRNQRGFLCSPMGIRADLHNAPGAAFLTFFQLVVYHQLSRLHLNPRDKCFE